MKLQHGSVCFVCGAAFCACVFAFSKAVPPRFRAACATKLLPLLLLLTLPAAVPAQLNYTTNNGTIAITAYSGPGGAVIIPDTTNGWPVTSIGSSAFAGCGNLASITIPDSVTSIGLYAFGRCTSLARVYFKGNAPSADSYVFSSAKKATVYYLPGSTGWETSFGGRPTAPWQPQVETSDANFGARTNQFGFTINWASGMTVVVEVCTDLANPRWLPLATNILASGSLYFRDPQRTNYPGRFYRLRWPGPSRRTPKKPYMGINTYYTIGEIDATAITNAANWLVSSGLKGAGYDTIQVDDGWNGYSDELFSTWTAGAGWSASSPFTHTAGATAGLTNAVAGAVARGYRVAYGVSGRTAGSFTITFGGQIATALTATGTWFPQASTAAQFVVTPNSDFNGTVAFSLASMRDAGGNWVVSTTKFPQGLKSVVNYVHSLGLKLGIYMGEGGMYGFCGWFPWQDAVFCATNGFDLIKVDGLPDGGSDITWLEVFAAECNRIYMANNQSPIWIQIHAQPNQAVWNDPRLWSIATSICPVGDIIAPWVWYHTFYQASSQHASFSGGVFPHMGFWTTTYPSQTSYGFPEVPDHVRLRQIRAMMGANAMLGSPLELASFMTNSWNDSGATLAILTNQNLIAIDQDPGQQCGYTISTQSFTSNELSVWIKPLGTAHGPEYAVALHSPSALTGTSAGDASTNIAPMTFVFTNLPGAPAVMSVLDCWNNTNFLATNSFTANVPWFDMLLFRLKPAGTVNRNSFDAGTVTLPVRSAIHHSPATTPSIGRRENLSKSS